MYYALAVLLALLALGAAGWAWSTKKTMKVMEETPTTPCSGIRGPGYYEVKGKIECTNPLQSPQTGEPCVFYRHVISEKVEESYRDSDGDWRTRTSWRTIEDDTRKCNFQVRDRTGSVEISPEGASFDTEKSGSQTTGGQDSSWGAEMGAMFGYRTYERQGQREEVWSLGLGQDIYAIGRVEQHPGGLCMGVDTQDGKPFILSNKSEEQQLAEYEWSFRIAVIVMIVCVVGAGMFTHYGATYGGP